LTGKLASWLPGTHHQLQDAGGCQDIQVGGLWATHCHSCVCVGGGVRCCDDTGMFAAWMGSAGSPIQGTALCPFAVVSGESSREYTLDIRAGRLVHDAVM
jgi:hypothetical protein